MILSKLPGCSTVLPSQLLPWGGAEDVQAAAAARDMRPSAETGAADVPDDAPDAAFFGSQGPTMQEPTASMTVPLRGYRFVHAGCRSLLLAEGCERVQTKRAVVVHALRAS